MKKTLGHIAYEAGFSELHSLDRARYEKEAKAVKRAVLRELRREGRLDPKLSARALIAIAGDPEITHRTLFTKARKK